jgi:hypothetical protein
MIIPDTILVVRTRNNMDGTSQVARDHINIVCILNFWSDLHSLPFYSDLSIVGGTIWSTHIWSSIAAL